VRVEVRLFATLARHHPRTPAGSSFDVTLEDAATLSDLAAVLGIPRDEIHLAMIDGRTVFDVDSALLDGCRVGLFPPIGGG